MALGPAGQVYIVETFNHRVRRLETPLPQTPDHTGVVSDDGRLRYEFDAAGRHLRTRDTLTGAVRYTFT